MKLSAHAQRRRTPVPWANWRATRTTGCRWSCTRRTASSRLSRRPSESAGSIASAAGRATLRGEPHGRQNLDVYRQLVEARSPA
jgi:hypothetical protein